MSDHEDNDLESWLKELDAGRHYRETPAFVVPALRQQMVKATVALRNRPDFLPGDPPEVELDRETRPLIPEDKFKELVRTTHNRFVEAVSNGDSLTNLEETLPDRLEVLTNQIDELDGRIESLEEIQDRCVELAERFETIDEAAGADMLPESVERQYQFPEGVKPRYRLQYGLQPNQLPDSEPQFVPFYDATELLGEEVEDPVYRGTRTPLRIAVHARRAARDIRRKERLPKRRAKAVGRLRLRILEYVRKHHQLIGIPPEKLSREDVEEEVENTQEEVRKDRRGGHPGQVASGRDIEERRPILNDLLGDPEFWKIENGEPVRPDYNAIYNYVRKNHRELFYVGKSAVRKYITRNFDLEAKRQELATELE